MSGYQRINFKDQNVERPKTYDVTNNPDGSITLIESFGNVEEIGTPINQENMNHIEDGIDAVSFSKFNIDSVYKQEDLVTEIKDGELKIYKSLINNNFGHLTNETDFWKETEIAGGSGLDGRITNCITSAPQRIKYTLVDGILTILAGSVVIVPFGTEDKTAEFPIGSMFLHENFKVYDRQFVDGKFTVWAELQNDISSSTTSTLTTKYFMSVSITDGTLNGSRYSESGTSTTTTNTYTIYYNTNAHLVNSSEGTTAVTSSINSFPIIAGYSNGTNYYGTTEEVYQYTGQIGGSMWLDKDVEALIPNGKNEDGTQKNIEWKSQKLYVTIQNQTSAEATSGEIGYNYDLDVIFNYGNYYELKDDGYIYSVNSGEIVRLFTFGIWETVSGGGNFKSYKPNTPFIAFDENKKYIASGWGYPSAKSIELAFGASNTSYIAPANGWFYVQCTFSANGNNYVALGGTKAGTINRSNYSGNCHCMIPVFKGDGCSLTYSSTTRSSSSIRFVYAQGEVQ